jgi:hypothetical protein
MLYNHIISMISETRADVGSGFGLPNRSASADSGRLH